jgi:cytochrome c oxidase assembly factor CtaG
MTGSFLASLPPLAGGAYLRSDLNPVPLAILGVAIATYAWGVFRNNRLHPHHRWPVWRTAAFVAASVLTGAATTGFLEVYSTVLFWDHMVQHLVLIMVCAVLFAVSSPVALAWRASTGRVHGLLAMALRSRGVEVVGHPVTAFLLYAVVIPVVHLTVFFNWTVEYRALNDAEHLIFLVAGYLFWRQFFGVDPNRFRVQSPIRALLLFLALPVDTFVGLTLDSENHEIFPALAAEHRAWGPSLVTDLHLGGVIMWVGGDVLMMLALIPVVVSWVRNEERRAVRVDRELEPWFPAPAPGGQPTAGFALGSYRAKRSAGGTGDRAGLRGGG